MSSTKWNQIEKIQFKFTKNYYAKYIHSHQVLNIAYYNPLYNGEDLFLYDTRTVIAPGYSSVING